MHGLRHAASADRPVVMIVNRGAARGDALATLTFDAGTTETPDGARGPPPTAHRPSRVTSGRASTDLRQLVRQMWRNDERSVSQRCAAVVHAQSNLCHAAG